MHATTPMKTRKPESTHPVDGALPALAGDGREQWRAAVEDPSRSSRRAHAGGGGDGGAGSPSNASSRAVSRAFTRALFPPVATLSSQLATCHLPAPPYASKQALAQPHAPCCRLTALTARSRRTAKPSQLATMLSNHHLLSHSCLPCIAATGTTANNSLQMHVNTACCPSAAQQVCGVEGGTTLMHGAVVCGVGRGWRCTYTRVMCGMH